MKRDILKDLYLGELYPGEEIVSSEADYRKTGHRIREIQEYLKSRLLQEDSRRVEELDSLTLQLIDMNAYANFAYGFRLGIMLMCGVFAGDDNP